MNQTESDLIKTKDKILAILRQENLDTNRYGIHFILNDKAFENLAKKYPEALVKHGNSKMILLSGVDDDVQWSIQISVMMAL